MTIDIERLPVPNPELLELMETVEWAEEQVRKTFFGDLTNWNEPHGR